MAKKKTAPSSGGEQEPTHPPVPGETAPESAPEETASAGPEEEDEEDLTQVAEQSTGANEQLRRMMNNNYIEYASYVIKDRAIPDVDDGLKPVQRRILWEMHRIDDGSFHKVANIVGGTMKFHPHGDASIEGALVYLANKELFIEKQGNFGSIVTGDRAAASRYIEARLSPLGREVLFNDDITELVESYDSRNLEPVRLPIKIPSLLLMGASGLAPGTRTDIMPHNFNELLNAQIAVLRDDPFQLYPDFLQGGIMDASEYEDGNPSASFYRDNAVLDAAKNWSDTAIVVISRITGENASASELLDPAFADGGDPGGRAGELLVSGRHPVYRAQSGYARCGVGKFTSA